MPLYDWNNYQWPTQPATFITPLTPPQNNVGTGAFGISQGGAGSRPALTPLAQSFANLGFGGFTATPTGGQFGGNIPTVQTAGGIAGEGGTFQQYGGFTPMTGKPTKQYRKPIGPQLPPTQLSAGTQTPALAPENIMPQVSGFVSPSTTGGMATDVFGQPLINPVNNKPVPNAPQAFTTDPQTGTPNFLYDQNGNPIASTLTGFQAQQAGLSAEELKASGYVQFGGTNGVGGTWIYNPVGGFEAQQQQNNLPWWQASGFESEKKANQYYTEKKRRERDAAKKKNPNRPSWGKKKSEGGSGVTTATSFMGTG